MRKVREDQQTINLRMRDVFADGVEKVQVDLGLCSNTIVDPSQRRLALCMGSKKNDPCKQGEGVRLTRNCFLASCRW